MSFISPAKPILHSSLFTFHSSFFPFAITSIFRKRS